MEKETIESAYAAKVKVLYDTMLSSYLAADGNKAMEKKADDAFKAGLAIAKRVREKAISLLP